MKTSLAVTPKILHRRHHQWEKGRKQFLQIIADKEIFLTRLSDDGRRINGIPSVKDGVRVEDRILMRKRIITVMIAKRPLGTAFVRRNIAADRKLCFREQTVVAGDRVVSDADLRIGE